MEVYSGSISFQNRQVLLSIIHDITDKKKAMLDLELTSNKLASIFRAAPTGIGVVSNRIITRITYNSDTYDGITSS